jgi:hypothetical protein
MPCNLKIVTAFFTSLLSAACDTTRSMHYRVSVSLAVAHKRHALLVLLLLCAEQVTVA